MLPDFIFFQTNVLMAALINPDPEFVSGIVSGQLVKNSFKTDIIEVKASDSVSRKSGRFGGGGVPVLVHNRFQTEIEAVKCGLIKDKFNFMTPIHSNSPGNNSRICSVERLKVFCKKPCITPRFSPVILRKTATFLSSSGPRSAGPNARFAEAFRL